MARYKDSSHICTGGGEVEVGGRYQYYEDGYLCDVTVLEDSSDRDSVRFKLRIDRRLRWPDDPRQTIECSATRGKHAYSGMWRLYPLGSYIRYADRGPEDPEGLGRAMDFGEG